MDQAGSWRGALAQFASPAGGKCAWLRSEPTATLIAGRFAGRPALAAVLRGRVHVVASLGPSSSIRFGPARGVSARVMAAASVSAASPGAVARWSFCFDSVADAVDCQETLRRLREPAGRGPSSGPRPSAPSFPPLPSVAAPPLLSPPREHHAPKPAAAPPRPPPPRVDSQPPLSDTAAPPSLPVGDAAAMRDLVARLLVDPAFTTLLDSVGRAYQSLRSELEPSPP